MAVPVGGTGREFGRSEQGAGTIWMGPCIGASAGQGHLGIGSPVGRLYRLPRSCCLTEAASVLDSRRGITMAKSKPAHRIIKKGGGKGRPRANATLASRRLTTHKHLHIAPPSSATEIFESLRISTTDVRAAVQAIDS